MNIPYKIPYLWLKLLAVVALTVFMFVQHLWFPGAIGIGLVGITAWQIRSAYKAQGSESETTP